MRCYDRGVHASDLAEPIGGSFGSASVWVAVPLMPLALGFAAGAMLFIISDEIILETHRSGYEDTATFSLLGGSAIMFLDTALAATERLHTAAMRSEFTSWAGNR